MNTLAYIIYLLITYLITVHVGFIFYRNGRVYMLGVLNNDERLTDFVNRILLVGYYLLNLGYATLMIRFWATITTWTGLLLSICKMTGYIMLVLSVMHFFNMTMLYLFRKYRQHFTHHK